eukprot:59656-Hanusia_phi.AAC.1
MTQYSWLSEGLGSQGTVTAAASRPDRGQGHRAVRPSDLRRRLLAAGPPAGGAAEEPGYRTTTPGFPPCHAGSSPCAMMTEGLEATPTRKNDVTECVCQNVIHLSCFFTCHPLRRGDKTRTEKRDPSWQ